MTLAEPPRALTHDGCIRGPLIAWLREQHPDDGSTELLEEFKMPRPSARIDLAVVNGELAGFEIKSDADTLVRLNVQVPAFSRFFDRVSVVTTRKHLSETKKRVPEWWGIIIYQGADGFRVARKGRRNRKVDVQSLLYSLSIKEIGELARRADRSLPKGRKDVLVAYVSSGITRDVICYHAREIIRQRVAIHRRRPSPPAHSEFAGECAY